MKALVLLIFLTGTFFCTFLPAQNNLLEDLHVNTCDPSSQGYYFFAPMMLKRGHYISVNYVLDNRGNVVYYKTFEVKNAKTRGPISRDFKLLPDGRMSYFYNDKFYFMDRSFRIIDSVSCTKEFETDPHELILLPDSHYVLLGFETVDMDLSPYKFFNKRGDTGSTNAKLQCSVLQELDSKKRLVFEWHAKDHYDFADIDTFFLSHPVEVDWQHTNSVHITADGNFVVSTRHHNEITKISRRDGHVIWRLGGKKSEFRFVNDPAMFKGQHHVRVLANGNISLFDNGRKDSSLHPESAKEYLVDEQEHTANLVWQYVDNRSRWSGGFGSVERLSNGNTLINYGRNDDPHVLFNVVDPKGKKIFELASSDTILSYRAYNYAGLPWALKLPKINIVKKKGQWFLEARDGYVDYVWSNGERGQSIVITKKGSYFVSVPTGSGGWLCSVPLVIEDPLHPYETLR